jgi:hypothetical protein
METLDKHFRNLTKSAFKTYGFAQGDVLAHWPQIVGEKLAQLSTPERITWPRGQDEKQGGTLYLKVNAGRILDVDYAAASIAEKVNRFLGYAAIARIKTSPRHVVPSPPSERHVKVQPDEVMMSRLTNIDDDDLKSALARLGAGLAAEQPRSPQPK